MKSSRFQFPDNLDDLKKFINFIASAKLSHRAVQYACNEVGISIDEIYEKKFEEIEDKNSTKELNELRFSHYEARRKAKINIISEYLNAHKSNFAKGSTSNKKITITPSHNRAAHSSELTTQSQEGNFDHKVRIMKSKIVNQLMVEENLKRIKQENEVKKTVTEQRIKEKEMREVKKIRNTKIFEVRDKRIKERLIKKQKDIVDHEEKALKLFQNSQSHLKAQLNSFTPPHRHLESEVDEAIEEKLEFIKDKLNKSAARAKKLLIEKVNSGQTLNNHIEKVKTLREQILLKQEEEYAQKVFRIHQDIELSNRRRAEILNEHKKMSKSVNQIKERKIKDESILHKKAEREYEEKDTLIEKIRKEVKELNEQKSHFLGMKIQLRKKDQEENLKRIKMQKLKEKNKLLVKLIDTDSLSKSKQDIDLNTIRAEAEKEFKTRISVLKKESEIVINK